MSRISLAKIMMLVERMVVTADQVAIDLMIIVQIVISKTATALAATRRKAIALAPTRKKAIPQVAIALMKILLAVIAMVAIVQTRTIQIDPDQINLTDKSHMLSMTDTLVEREGVLEVVAVRLFTSS